MPSPEEIERWQELRAQGEWDGQEPLPPWLLSPEAVAVHRERELQKLAELTKALSPEDALRALWEARREQD